MNQAHAVRVDNRTKSFSVERFTLELHKNILTGGLYVSGIFMCLQWLRVAKKYLRDKGQSKKYTA